MVDQNARPRPSAERQAALRAAIELFFFGYRAFTAQPDRILERRGLSRAHHRVLYFVGREPGIAVSALLQTLGVSKQALNGPLRRLLDDGLVTARAADHDRRVRQLRLTADGERLEAQLTGTQMRQLSAAFERVGPRAESAWREAMEAIEATARREP